MALKKIAEKIFHQRTSISNWLLILAVYTMFLSMALVYSLSQTIEKEQYLRMCPEPYICVEPPIEWKARTPFGLKIYKRIPA
tara:strand:- start:3290 stop:3535 length:246 start_codon:yes stop_codon:yes gene_type:complete